MTRVLHHPLPAGRPYFLTTGAETSVQVLHGAGVSAVLLALVLTIRGALAAYGPTPQHTPAPRSWLTHTTLLTVYGRGFGTAPILGRLGMDHTFDDVARQVLPAETGIRANNGGARVRIAIHLIYALAVPCTATNSCLLYADDAGVDLVNQYIVPAARRGWLVVLDDQLGHSNPQAEIRRMVAKGYLQYDNVEVAFDPEFHTPPGQVTPGIPTGSVTTDEINKAQDTLNAYASGNNLLHRKIVMVHEWTQSMIRKTSALTSRFRFVQPVVIMDGIGSPSDKARVYDALLRSHASRGGVLPGIKLFPPGPYAPSRSVDIPTMTWSQVFGRTPARDVQGTPYYVSPLPRVIVLT